MKVHLIDGTYELFRQYFGQPSTPADGKEEVAAVRGVVGSVLGMVEAGATHIGVATDHVIESFRNDMWPTYKNGSGIDPELLSQFPLLEEALAAFGFFVWPMVELEADDALASAAAVAADDQSVDQVVICTPDKDLAQCVVGDRVVQLDRRAERITDEDGVRDKFGVDPESIPDWLALVGDSADGFPGLAGWGKRSASVLLAHYRHLEDVPEEVGDWDATVVRGLRGAKNLSIRLAEERDAAFLFRDLATLRVDRALLRGTGDLEWRGPTGEAEAIGRRLRAPNLAERARRLAA
jgi:5'-3' exonuclease